MRWQIAGWGVQQSTPCHSLLPMPFLAILAGPFHGYIERVFFSAYLTHVCVYIYLQEGVWGGGWGEGGM